MYPDVICKSKDPIIFKDKTQTFLKKSLSQIADVFNWTTEFTETHSSVILVLQVPHRHIVVGIVKIGS